MLLLGDGPAGAHGNVLERPEKDPHVSPPWVHRAAPGKALVGLTGKGVRCLPAGCSCGLTQGQSHWSPLGREAGD